MDKIKASKKELEVKRDKALDELTMLGDLYNEKRQQIVLEREKQSVAEKSLSEIGREIESSTDLIEEVKKRISKIDADYEAVQSGGKKLEEDRASASQNADKHPTEGRHHGTGQNHRKSLTDIWGRAEYAVICSPPALRKPSGQAHYSRR